MASETLSCSWNHASGDGPKYTTDRARSNAQVTYPSGPRPPQNTPCGIRRLKGFGDLHVDFGLAPGLIPGLNELARHGLAAGTDAQAIKSDAESGGSVFADDRSPNREDNTKPGPTYYRMGRWVFALVSV